MNDKESRCSLKGETPFVRVQVVQDLQESLFEEGSFFIGGFEDGGEKYLLNRDEVLLQSKKEKKSKSLKKERQLYLLSVEKEFCQKLQSTLFEDVKSFIPLKEKRILNATLFKSFLKLFSLLAQNKISRDIKETILKTFLSSLFLEYCDRNYIKIERSKQFIKLHIKEKLSIDKLCEYTSLSKFYFIRLFKEFTKTTPHSYILSLRVDEVKKLLKTDMKTSEIAATVGFTDQSHLSRAFKEMVGVTPLDYKKSLQKSA